MEHGGDLRDAERVLRASEQECLAAWAALVEAERRQVEALPDRPRPEDFYAPIAESFRADPRRRDDAALDLVMTQVRPDETWLDLGAGGGRFALPIALSARRVYAVEPSAGMRSTLAAAVRQEGIDNIDIYPERWPGASEAPVADVGFIAHVGYDIADIGPFLDQLEAHARRLCVALLFDRSPIMDFAPLWPLVHGERRVRLPALREFVSLLFSRGTPPELRTLAVPAASHGDLEALRRVARRPLWVRESTEKDAALANAVRALAIPVAGGYALSTTPRTLGLVTWAPRRPAAPEQGQTGRTW
jgi:hypothetical protein